MFKNQETTSTSHELKGSILIVGAGIGGMQAALDLANAGFKVHLLQKESAIGGTMAMLDKTFPTGDCAMCMISPRMVELGRHPNIILHTLSQVKAVQGSPGNFQVQVFERPRYVDPNKCTGCGICEKKCPKLVTNPFEQGLSKRKAIYSLMAQAVPSTRVIDPEHCIYLQRGKCRACEKFCEAEAINFADQPKEYELTVGAIILAPGLDRFDPGKRQELGFGRWPNVLTSVQFERILSASGPFLGEVKRPSDETHPQKIAWIQCVGSRDTRGNPWCSSVCCMYATKQAIIAKEHDRNIEATIFYMDLRAFGKDFDKYVEKAKQIYGVKYKRAMISQVMEEAKSNDLILRYSNEQGQLKEEKFNLIVLSVGLEPHKDIQNLAQTFDIELDPYNFAKTSTTSPIDTNRPGIFVLGTFQGPKDIPETVIQGSAAAGKAMALLGEARGKEIEQKTLPPELEVSDQEPRIGVFVCHCGINIAQTVNIQEVVAAVRDLPQVIHAENMLYSCSQDSQERIKALVKEKGLNRVLVASCTPRTHESLFQETIRDAGLNKYLFELADIREQCSWCHMGDNQAATKKAIEIVKMHIGKVRKLRPIHTDSVPVTPGALIIGGGIAGITAGLSLADQGFQVHLVEKEDKLGGLLNQVFSTLGEKDIQTFLQKKINSLASHPLVQVHLGTEVVATSGFVGNFQTRLSNGQTVDHGAILITCGGRENVPSSYNFGQDKRVITQRELEKRLQTTPPQPGETFCMIQCVESREEPHNYCSRICCQDALKNSIAIKEASPKSQVVIFYRDLRSYGLREIYYRRARELGVIFVHFSPPNKPQVAIQEDKIQVQGFDFILNKEITFQTDWLVLSTGLLPHPSAEEVGKLYKLTRNEDGFFLEAHVKLRPVDFPSEGIFLAGLAHGPKNLDETIAQALAAASRAGILLSHKQLDVSGIVATHNRDICMSCLACFRICPFDSPFIDKDGKVSHNQIKCMGCGLCAGICPAKAFQVNKFEDEQIWAMIDEAVPTS